MRIVAEHALLPGGWAHDVAIEVNRAGFVSRVSEAPEPPRAPAGHVVEARAGAGHDGPTWHVPGFLVPGMPNLHSHAFQRAMAGLTEARTHPADSFWTWRELMYRFAARITPRQMADVAAWLYVEMLKGGYTSVAEFHYLHHDTGGRRYADPGETSHRVIAAAREAGIAITHLPVLYAHGGFGAAPTSPEQARFLHTGEEYAALVGALAARYGGEANVAIGAAFHSLRAVDGALIGATLAALEAIDDAAPIHIHVAEQRREVDDCLAWSGQRPVEWLLDRAPVDARWCLVHATHLDARELERVAASGAVAGLCPTTEANLGDGIFPAREYLTEERAGAFGIGSDSHVSVSVAAELKLLEYGQRLTARRRAVLASEARPSPARRLYEDAAAGGARALGLEAGRIAAGSRADLVALDAAHPALWNKRPDQVLDAWVFAGDAGCVRDVMVGGEWRIVARRHAREEELARRYRAAQAALVS